MIIEQATVRELFDYHIGGHLVWKKSKMMKSGMRAGCLDNSTGYVTVHAKGRNYGAHRLIFLWHHGYLPRVIDHINGVRSDNRIENLRATDFSGNAQNRSRNGKCLSGVSYSKRYDKWTAQICFQNKRTNLGYYDSQVSAAITYNIAALRLHGQFANLNKIPFIAGDPAILSRISACEEKETT